MNRYFVKNWSASCLVLSLLAGGLGQNLLAQCTSCGNGQQEQTVRFHLRGVASMAGTATVTITTASNTTPPITFQMAADPSTIVFSPGLNRYVVDHYQCVPWDQEYVMDVKINEPILISYTFDNNPLHSSYTEFESLSEPNPIIYYTRPSSPCLKVYFDGNDGNWVAETPVFITTSLQIRIKGMLGSDDSNAGECIIGPTAGGGQPLPEISNLTDSEDVGDVPCPGGGDSPQMANALRKLPGSSPQASSATIKNKTSVATGKNLRSSFLMVKPRLNASEVSTNSAGLLPHKSHSPMELMADNLQPRIPNQQKIAESLKAHLPSTAKNGRQVRDPQFELWHSMTDAASPGKASLKSVTTSAKQALPRSSVQSPSAGNGYSITTPIGRLRWEMSLGSVGRAHSLGTLIYQTDAIDNNAYSPARLSLTSGGDRSSVILDGSGNLQQITAASNLVSIQTTANGFVVTVSTNGVSALTWTVDNPDPTPLGRIRFTKTEGTNTEVHVAQWQGTIGQSGTMTISRYGGKWVETRDYSINSNATQRIEMVSQYKGATLQHKVRDMYQQFYNWGNPGDIFEALVQRTEDPDNKALTTSYVYWDSTNQPGNLLYQATYPDGYSEQTPNRISGNGFSPVVSSGGAVQTREPFKDLDPSSSGARVINTYYNQLSDSQITEETVTTIGGLIISDHYVTHTFTNGFWIQQILDFTDVSGGYAYEERWRDLETRQPVYQLDRDGKSQNIFYEQGFWDTSSQQFGFSPSSSTVPAQKTIVINGSGQNQNGIANKTTVDVTVEDSFGHLVEEDSFVSDGSGSTDPSRLIDHKIHTYTDSRLTASYQNGRLVYQANYDGDGKMLWEEDASGRHADYAYDEMKRVIQRIVRGRGGDADQVCTYDYDVFGNKISDVTVAGGLTNQTGWIYNLAGELTATIGIDGLTNSLSTDYASGHKIITETLPTQATRISSFFKDRQPRSLTGTAVENQYYNEFIFYSSPFSFLINGVYRDSGLTQEKRLRMVNWVGNEILFETPQFQTGFRDRFTDYAFDVNGQSPQLVAEIQETGRATQLFTYDELGQLTTQGLDLDGNGTLDPVSLDRMAIYDQIFTNDLGFWQQMDTVQRFLQDSNATPTLVQRSRATVPAALNGVLIASNTVERIGGGIALTSVALDPSTGNQTTTVSDLELGQVSTRIERDGLSRSEVKPGIGIPWTYSYTALGELQTVIDPVVGAVTNTYDAVTRRLMTVTDSLNRQTTYGYFPAGANNAGKIEGIQDPAGNSTYFDYTPAGQLFRQWGVNTYPIQQQYDEAGRMTNLMTFRTSGGSVNWASPTWPNPPAGDITRWVYDQPSGLLAQKLYADNKGISYGYNSGNFLNTKTNGRGQIISYNVDTTELLRNVAYSDNTPAVALDYDRAGRLRSSTDASGTRNISWTDRDQMQNESYTAGLLTGVTVTRDFDSQFRLQALGLSIGGVPTLRQRYAYDSISWLDYITDETPDGATVLHKFDYTFKPNTPFVQSVDFYRGSTAIMTQSYTRDSLGRLAGAGTTLAGNGTLNGVNYQFDNLDRRFEADLADGTKWNYGYDNRSEVTSGKRQLMSGVYAGGEQFEYTFDDIGNRMQTKSGGDTVGANLRLANYSANLLNQIASRDVPGSIWIVGEAATNLTLQGVGAGRPFTVQRQDGQRFFGEAIVSNSQSSAYASVKIAGKANGALNDVEAGHEFIPQTPETPAYDDDGNLTSDGRWTYTWDAENRLVSVVARADIPDAAKRRVDFVYDYQGRRMQKIVSAWNGSAYVTENTNRFVYDGWDLVAELDANASLVRSYMWGLDLSGTMQGAGGVGGLLQTIYYGLSTTNCFPTFDGNGNVTALVNAQDGGITAQYEYGPFGEVLRATGSMAKINVFRFSTKFQDDEGDLLYYGYRYYNSAVGKWLSRDASGEGVTPNLYCPVKNSLLNSADFLGLYQLVFGEGMSDPRRRAIVNKRQNEVGDKLPSVIARIKKEIAANPFAPGCCGHDDYDKDLKFLLDIVTKVQNGINSTKNLHIKSNDHLQNGADAYAETQSYWSTITLQDKPGKTRFWDIPIQGQDSQDGTLFHEMTHLFGTDDNTDYLPNEAATYEDLLSDDNIKSVFMRIKNAILIKCRDEQKKKKN